MSLLDKLADPSAWADFYRYRTTHGSLSKKELKALESLVAEQHYLPIAQTLEFSLPQKKLINKSG